MCASLMVQWTYWKDSRLEVSAIKDESCNASCGQKSKQVT